MTTTSALSVRGLAKAYPGVRALDGVDLDVLPGEVHVLLGENGAGKSTLVKILSGAIQPDAGCIVIGGETVVLGTPHVAQQAGISTVHQELSLVPDLTVAQNLFLGQELVHSGAPFLDSSAMNRRASELLAALGLRLDPEVPVRRLSLAVRQVVEIVRALSRHPRILILDEPTSSLTDREVTELFTRVRQITATGVGVIYISHRLEELAQIADRVTVMRDGRIAAAGLPASTPLPQLVRLMVGREVGQEFPPHRTTHGDVMLKVRNLTIPDRVEDVSFDVHAGEVVGFFGLVGAGRTELLRGLYGLDRSRGTIELAGNRLDGGSPHRSLKHGLALVPEDRHGWGLVLPMSIQDNISLSALDKCTSWGVLRRSRVADLGKRFMAAMRIKAKNGTTGVEMLSGGNQQKVVIARTLAAGSQVLLLDEPTRGVDIGAKIEIYELVAALAAEGKAVVIVSSELPEVMGLSDRIFVMRQGRISAEFSYITATPEALLSAALTHEKGTE
jgi:ribose transport system ATP-binding protein